MFNNHCKSCDVVMIIVNKCVLSSHASFVLFLSLPPRSKAANKTCTFKHEQMYFVSNVAHGVSHDQSLRVFSSVSSQSSSQPKRSILDLPCFAREFGLIGR